MGSPNVGKSVMFGNLTGTYVTVSNYPGTTVEVTRGHAAFGGRSYEVVDTPGMYSLLPLSEEERVARVILFDRRPTVVLHLVDAKNLERMLLFTVQLIETGLPVALVVNLLDEAEERGMTVDLAALRRDLGIPVVGTVGTTGRGMAELRELIAARRARRAGRPVPLPGAARGVHRVLHRAHQRAAAGPTIRSPGAPWRCCSCRTTRRRAGW